MSQRYKQSRRRPGPKPKPREKEPDQRHAPTDASEREHNELGFFVQKGPEPLAKKAKSVRLPKSIDELVNRLPSVQRSDWLRRVIGEAAMRELSDLPDDESERVIA